MLSAIVAHDRNGIIGKDNHIPWHLPNDLKQFKRITLGKPIVMGRRTFESIGRPLPGRLNVVLSQDPSYRADGCRMASSLDAAVRDLEAEGYGEVVIIGGARLYREALPRCRRLYRTVVDGEFEGDVTFPPIDESEWAEKERHVFAADEQNPWHHTLQILERVG